MFKPASAALLAALAVAPSGAVPPRAAAMPDAGCARLAQRVVIAAPGMVVRITARDGQALVVARGPAVLADRLVMPILS